MPGKLSVLGSGIAAVAHITIQAQGIIEAADKVFFLLADPITKQWLLELRPDALSLHDCYVDGEARHSSYIKMAETIVTPLSENLWVCAIFYGHPGVFVLPSHLAVEMAKKSGFYAEMLPGLSAEDCLFADLGIDPATHGCQSYESTDFLLYDRIFDRHSSLVLWQVGVVGDLTFKKDGYNNEHLKILLDKLLEFYPPDHEVILYEASQYIICHPRIERIHLGEILSAKLSAITTLFVPPAGRSPLNFGVVQQLGLMEYFQPIS